MPLTYKKAMRKLEKVPASCAAVVRMAGSKKKYQIVKGHAQVVSILENAPARVMDIKGGRA